MLAQKLFFVLGFGTKVLPKNEVVGVSGHVVDYKIFSFDSLDGNDDVSKKTHS